MPLPTVDRMVLWLGWVLNSGFPDSKLSLSSNTGWDRHLVHTSTRELNSRVALATEQDPVSTKTRAGNVGQWQRTLISHAGDPRF